MAAAESCDPGRPPGRIGPDASRPCRGVRSIVLIEVQSVQTSCGSGVPRYEYQGQRPALTEWAERQGSQAIARYWAANNRTSIDGLPTGIAE